MIFHSLRPYDNPKIREPHTPVNGLLNIFLEFFYPANRNLNRVVNPRTNLPRLSTLPVAPVKDCDPLGVLERRMAVEIEQVGSLFVPRFGHPPVPWRGFRPIG